MGISIESLAKEGITKEALLEQIQRTYEANFNQQEALRNISDLETDISSLEIKRSEALENIQMNE